jgi:hypothetical protein
MDAGMLLTSIEENVNTQVQKVNLAVISGLSTKQITVVYAFPTREGNQHRVVKNEISRIAPYKATCDWQARTTMLYPKH